MPYLFEIQLHLVRCALQNRPVHLLVRSVQREIDERALCFHVLIRRGARPEIRQHDNIRHLLTLAFQIGKDIVVSAPVAVHDPVFEPIYHGARGHIENICAVQSVNRIRHHGIALKPHAAVCGEGIENARYTFHRTHAIRGFSRLQYARTHRCTHLIVRTQYEHTVVIDPRFPDDLIGKFSHYRTCLCGDRKYAGIYPQPLAYLL